MRIRATPAMSLLGLSLFAPVAAAHLPIISDGSATTAAQAIELNDVQVSRAIYHDARTGNEQIWLAFEVDRPQKLVLRIGVPQLERLRELRPAVAFIGPGLPLDTIPPELQPSLGGVEVVQSAALYDTTGVTEFTPFSEEFTGTESWILLDANVDLPAAGRYYVAGYVPGGAAGKFWFALGVKEQFGPDDIASLPETIAEVRAFHEDSASGAPCFLIPAAAVLVIALAFHGRRRV